VTANSKPSEETNVIQLFQTDSSKSRAFQRIALAAVMFPHGAQKLLGWFGGPGFDGIMGYLTKSVGLPTPVAFLVVIAESVGAVALAAGAFTRVAAFGIAAVMTGAVLTSHLSNGFFMNWMGNQAGEGFEFHLLALALALPLIVRGGGAWAADSWLGKLLFQGERRPSLQARTAS
jgi:putative oxidoreductase